MRTVLEGITKPTPFELPERLWVDVVIPSTCARVFRRTPPELPGLIAVSVWIPSVGTSFGEDIGTWSPLTTPRESDPAWPNGLPIATTSSPTRVVAESASVSGWRTCGRRVILITARSLSGSRRRCAP